jgi:hypothetical protein
MKYLLDTNICIYLINGKFDYLIDRIPITRNRDGRYFDDHDCRA